MELTEPVLALLAAVFGGAGLKLIETLLARSNKRTDVAKEIRDELREEIVALKSQLSDVQHKFDKWKRQYYDLLVAFNELVVAALGAGLTDDVNRIRRQLEDDKDDDVQS